VASCQGGAKRWDGGKAGTTAAALCLLNLPFIIILAVE
jgi:hypothetical protein